MEIEPPSQLLQHQHRQIDVGVEGIVDGSGSLESLAESLRLLYLHIYVEEEFLFPPLERFGITMPIFVMKKEHAEMWPFLQALDDGVKAEASIESLKRPARSLSRLLRVHNPKEEEVVYTAADRLVAEQPDQPWLEALTTGEVPTGWSCALAGSEIAASPFAMP